MCQYAGGKARVGKKIFEAMRDYEKLKVGHHDTPYFEPFVGMGGVLTQVSTSQSREIFACDREECVISFWRGIQRGWKPSEITKTEYTSTKKNGDVSDPMYAFTAFGSSFRGMRWGGYSEDSMKRASRRIEKKDFFGTMKRVKFLDNESYVCHRPSGMMIYCDPPYQGSVFDKRKGNLLDFDTVEFWEVVRTWSTDNMVFVSERQAPDDFECILEFDRKNGLIDEVLTEKVFVIKR